MLYNTKKFSMIFIHVLIISICFLMQGCISTMSMTPENRKLIKTIEVNKKVVVPRTIFYQSRGDLILSNVLPLAYVIDKDLHGFPELNQIQDFADENKINFSKILRTEVINQLKQNGKFEIVTAKSVDAVLKLEVRSYGLSPADFSEKLGPVLSVIGILTNPIGKIIWKDSICVCAAERRMPKFTKEELLHDPRNLYLVWDEAAKEASEKLVKSLTS